MQSADEANVVCAKDGQRLCNALLTLQRGSRYISLQIIINCGSSLSMFSRIPTLLAISAT